MKNFNTRKLLHRQMELLAEQSENCMEYELPRYSNAMAEIYKQLVLSNFLGVVGFGFLFGIIMYLF